MGVKTRVKTRLWMLFVIGACVKGRGWVSTRMGMLPEVVLRVLKGGYEDKSYRRWCWTILLIAVVSAVETPVAPESIY